MYIYLHKNIHIYLKLYSNMYMLTQKFYMYIYIFINI